MNTTLSISNKGMFLNNDRVNLLESDFRKLLCKYGISDDSIANCVIFYSYNPEETVQKAKRTPFSIFNVIDAGAGYLELLLNCGVNPNEGLYDNLFTPLMYAVFHKNINATKILLEHGANVNATTIANGTALRIAVHMKNIEMAALLIEYGADVNFLTDGITNLRFALEEPAPNKELVRLLSLCGGIVNIDDNNAAFCLTEDLEAALSLWSFKEIITSSPAAYVPSSKHKEL